MNEEFSFMKEKIKDKPFYKKKWVQVVCATIILAVLFGIISGYVFSKMYRWMEKKQTEEAVQNIEIPKDQPEVEEQSEAVPDTSAEEEKEPVIVEAELTLEEYGNLYRDMRVVANTASKSLVTVTAVNNDVDWFNEQYENNGQSTGMIIGDNGVELLVLTKYSEVEECDGINVTFTDDSVASAVLKKYDVTTDLAVISVNLSDISENTKAKIVKATLGNSMHLSAGTPVIAIGRADGSEDSMKVGVLTSTKNKQSVVDAEYTVLLTDMLKNAGSDGVLINFKGEIVGIIQEKHEAANMKDVISAYAISDIKSLLEHLSNSQDIAYLGIKAVTVTQEALRNGIPSGVYVTDVVMDSPAMLGGIQSGDVLQAINGQKVTQMSELTAVLERLSNRQNISLEGRRLTKDGYKKINYTTSLSVLE
ncbi:MAG: serine protease [Lachnospiraceae bacterium]|nr:serine protease [Lachnospiraceae bacterium]